MNKHLSKEEHDIIRLSRNFQRGNTAEQRMALAKALLAKERKEKANKIAEILYEAFGKDFDIGKDEGYRRYHVSKKNGSVQWLKEGQMVMTVQPDASIIIRLNSPEWNVLYIKKNLSKEDFVAELDVLKAFIAEGKKLPEESKIKKIAY